MEAKVEITKESLKQIQKKLDQIYALTSKEMPVVVNNALADFCYEAIKATPMSPKIIPFREYKVKGERKYWISLHHKYTGERKIFKGSRQQAKEYNNRDIKGRGYTKAGWLECLKKLGKNVRSRVPNKSSETKAENNAQVRKAKRGVFKTKGMVRNSTPYIEDFNNGRNRKHTPLFIDQKAFFNVMKRMDKAIDKLKLRAKKKFESR